MKFLAAPLLAGALLAVASAAPIRSLAAATADMAQVERGKEIYEKAGGVGCIACHGSNGEGKIGPANRGVNEATIRAALQNIGAMQFLRDQITDQEIKQLAAYTEWMGQHVLLRILLKRGRFIPEMVKVHPGTPIQLVIENTGAAPSTVGSDDLGTAPVTIPGRDNASIIWAAPAREGNVTLACTDCKIKDSLFTIEVTNAAKPYTPPPQPKVLPKPAP